MKKTSAFINFMGLRGFWIFFLLMWYLGIPYTGIEDSNHYMLFWIFVSTLTTFQILGYFIKKTIPKSLLISVVIVASIIMFFYSADMMGSRYFNLFIGTSIPCIFLGINCAINRNEEKCMNYLEYLLILSFIPFLFIMWEMFQELGGPRLRFETGAGPMGVGYRAAVFFVYLAMVSIIKGRESNVSRYSFVAKVIRNKYFIFISMFFLTLVVLATGSRGPLVAILIAPVLLMFIYRGNLSIKTFRSIIIIILLLTGFVYLVAYNPYPGFEVPLSRVTNLYEGLTTGELLETASTGRDLIYEKAIDLFSENLVFGSGFYTYAKIFGTYPHNIILEILTNHGIIGLVVWIGFFAYIFAGIVKRMKFNINTIPFYSILAVEVIRLMFSSTYINSFTLWFFVGYGISCRLDKPHTDRDFHLKKHL